MKRRERRSVERVVRDTLAVVMAGGRGTRLNRLTARHSKPAVPFGGKYRIIDFTLSNCINSGIHKIAILTQYRAHSLIRHVERAWSFFRDEFGEFVELLPAQERFESSSWYLGTADSVYQNLDIIQEHRPSYVLVLAGDHVYKMDYGVMIAAHLRKEADVTVGCVSVPVKESSHFGIIEADEDGRIIGFEEKPKKAKPKYGHKNMALASMGIYLFSIDNLLGVLERDAQSPTSSHDFGKDILPSIYQEHRVYTCQLDVESSDYGYWRDVGTVHAYWQANLELIGVTPPLNLYDPDWPIRTYQAQLPPAKFVFDDDDRRGMAVDSMVSAGCIVSGSKISHSLLSNNVRVHSYSVIKNSVLLPNVVVGRNCQIANAVIDSDCRLPENTVIGENLEADRKHFHVTPEGIVLVCPEMLGQKVRYGI
ncbi:MAG: glucose-1-phosphate adenylyltransferase [Gammaproteobacteria bacterium RIFCSPLOWO2_02_FULL_52_10]|nr:MAG: glucose-1-phosphate adenylyltransferase [Gammaproteobacteria bacterium RIFCSPLOWO2_02_FULL_52_10]